MKLVHQKLFQIFMLGLSLSSCGSRTLSDDDSVVFPAKFSAIRDRIIIPKCANCHGALISHKEFSKGIYLEGEQGRGTLLDLIKSGAMPQYGQPLGNPEIKAIETWINQGAKND